MFLFALEAIRSNTSLWLIEIWCKEIVLFTGIAQWILSVTDAEADTAFSFALVWNVMIKVRMLIKMCINELYSMLLMALENISLNDFLVRKKKKIENDR